MNSFYQSQAAATNTNNPHYQIRPVTVQDDKALGELISIPMTTRGIKISFQREPSYFQSAQVIYEVKDLILIENQQDKQIVAYCSNGSRTCYINGTPQPVRYGSDLRVKPQQRGKHLVKMLLNQLQETMQQPDFTQIVIFNDNKSAKAAVQSSTLGNKAYHDDCLVETLTLTGFKTPDLTINQLPSTSYNRNYNPNFSNTIEVIQANASYVDCMTDFVKNMAEFYNFIPAYNFQQLLQKHPYYLGLDISDFYLFYQNQQLVGLFGLWSQSQFKQTKIVDYGKTVGCIRPFYNLWARWSGQMPLPRKGETMKYHVLHSLLCKPDDLQLHDYMLRTAMKVSQQRRIGRIAYTLSVNDPRQRLNTHYKGERLTGMHGFLCFNENPSLKLDAQRITYLECGRI